jgi:hypothetical protein
MSVQKLAGLFAALGFVLLILSAFLGSALFGSEMLADWSPQLSRRLIFNFGFPFGRRRARQ